MARFRTFGKFLQPFPQRPQHQPQPGRRGFQQGLLKHGELTKPDAMLAQGGACLLVQRLDVFGDIAARDDAELFAHPERKALGQPGQRLVAGQRQQRLKRGGNLAVDKVLQAALHFGNHLRPRLFIDKRHDLRLHRLGACGKLAHGMLAPHQATLFGEINLGIRRVVKPVGAQMELRGEGLRGRLRQRFRLVRATGFIHPEPEPFQPPDEFALDGHITLVTDFGHKDLLLLEPPGQHTGPPVHKSLSQRAMQRIRQSVFYVTRGIPPMGIVPDPAAPLGHISPGADKGQPFGQSINVAIGPVNPRNLLREVGIGDSPRLVQVVVNLGQKAGMFGAADPPEIGNAADIPQQADRRAVRGAGGNFGVPGQRFQRRQIIAFADPGQPVVRRPLFQRLDQAGDGPELQPGIAPLQPRYGAKMMIFNGLNGVIIQRFCLSRHPKGAVGQVPPGPTGDLGQLIRGQMAHPCAVKLDQG